MSYLISCISAVFNPTGRLRGGGNKEGKGTSKKGKTGREKRSSLNYEGRVVCSRPVHTSGKSVVTEESKEVGERRWMQKGLS